MDALEWARRTFQGAVVGAYVVLIGSAALSAAPLPSLGYHREQHASEAERDVARADAQTRAQIWVAWASWVQVAISGAGLIGLALTVFFARNAWLESKESAVQAKRSADLTDQLLREAERGRLFIVVDQETIEFTGTEKDIPVINFRIQNVGARHVVIRLVSLALTLRPSGQRDGPEWPRRLSSSSSTVHPILLKSGDECQIDGAIYNSGIGLSEENWPGIDGEPFFFGRVLYTDHLDIYHEYKFCFECYSPNDDWDGMIQFKWARDVSER